MCFDFFERRLKSKPQNTDQKIGLRQSEFVRVELLKNHEN
jgi:hypothetical protein